MPKADMPPVPFYEYVPVLGMEKEAILIPVSLSTLTVALTTTVLIVGQVNVIFSGIVDAGIGGVLVNCVVTITIDEGPMAVVGYLNYNYD